MLDGCVLHLLSSPGHLDKAAKAHSHILDEADEDDADEGAPATADPRTRPRSGDRVTVLWVRDLKKGQLEPVHFISGICFCWSLGDVTGMEKNVTQLRMVSKSLGVFEGREDPATNQAATTFESQDLTVVDGHSF